jgi:hypothetical protein
MEPFISIYLSLLSIPWSLSLPSPLYRMQPVIPSLSA